jgi:hypothetical protein
MPTEKVQRDKQRSKKHTYKTKDRVTQTPLRTGGEHRCSGRVGSSCCTSDTRRANIATYPVIGREWGKAREVLTTSGTYPWSCVTQIFHNGQPRHGDFNLTMFVRLLKAFSLSLICHYSVDVYKESIHVFITLLVY